MFERDLLLVIFLVLTLRVGAGPMRNYTGIYHPAGGADPRYLNYGQGVAVPSLQNPRIPAPGFSLTPQHHLERYIGVPAGPLDDEEMAGYDDSYYEYDENENVVYPDVISPGEFQTHPSDVLSDSRRVPHTKRYDVRLRTIIFQNDENDDSEEEIDDGIGNEGPGYDGASADEDNHAAAPEAVGCQDGDQVYRPGDSFTLSSDPCTQCNCTVLGQICSGAECDPLPPTCLELRGEPGQCCPVCVKQGCEFENVTYNVGQIIQTTPCQTCRCEDDGHAYCSVADCVPPLCVDPIVHAGECCPVCPNGPNCYASSNRTVIAARPEWVPLPNDGCTICRCRHEPAGLELWMGNREAECKSHPICGRRGRHDSPRSGGKENPTVNET